MALRVFAVSLTVTLYKIVLSRATNAASRVGALYVRRYLDLGRVDPAQTKPTHSHLCPPPTRKLTTTPSAHVTTPMRSRRRRLRERLPPIDEHLRTRREARLALFDRIDRLARAARREESERHRHHLELRERRTELLEGG